MKPETAFSTSQGASLPLSGMDPVMLEIKRRGLPATRENYVQLAGLQEPLQAEQEALLLEALSKEA